MAIRQCMVCGCEFEALGSDKTCSPEHSKARKAYHARKRYASSPDFRRKSYESCTRYNRVNSEKLLAQARARYARNAEHCRE